MSLRTKSSPSSAGKDLRRACRPSRMLLNRSRRTARNSYAAFSRWLFSAGRAASLPPAQRDMVFRELSKAVRNLLHELVLEVNILSFVESIYGRQRPQRLIPGHPQGHLLRGKADLQVAAKDGQGCELR